MAKKLQDKKIEPGKTLLQWEAGRVKKNRNAIYWVVGLFVVILASIAYFGYRNEWSSVAVFFLLLLTSIWYIFVSIKTAKVVITENGFWIDSSFYQFENIKGFWVVEDLGLFYFVTKGRLTSSISFPLGNTSIEKLMSLLPEELVEVEGMGEDLQDKIARIFSL